MQASELKSIADQVNQQAADPQIEETYRRISFDLREAAKAGKYSLSIYLRSINISRPIWERVAEKLRADKLIVTFDTEITAWYSNTDWDQEELIKVSWL